MNERIPTASFSTAAAAKILEVAPQTMRKAHYRDQAYLGIRPFKMPNGRLRWPRHQVLDLVNGDAHVGSEGPGTSPSRGAAK